MSKIYINKVSENSHDFAYDASLPVITILIDTKPKKILIGLQYSENDFQNRNLYDLSTKTLIGVIKYKTIKMNINHINDPKKYKVYLLDN